MTAVLRSPRRYAVDEALLPACQVVAQLLGREEAAGTWVVGGYERHYLMLFQRHASWL